MYNKVGAQYYTVRNFCKTKEDFDETCRKVREIGYTFVQLSGIGDFEPEFIKETLDKHGLFAICTHRPPLNYLENIEKEIEFHKTIGIKYAGIGSVYIENVWNDGITKEGMDKFLADFNKVADRLYEEGLVFCCHNHHLEFAKYNGKYWFDYMVENTNPEKFKFILDAYWLSYSGVNPVDYIKKLKDRIACVHLKDIRVANGKPEIQLCEVGAGNINWDDVLDACKYANVPYAVVEQDYCENSPFDSLKQSYDFLVPKYFEN